MSPATLLQLHRTTTTTTTTTTTNTTTTTTTTKTSSPATKMNFINKGIMTGRAKLSKIIHVKPFQLTDEKNKENLDISKPMRHRSPDATLPDTKLPSSLTNSIEDVYVGSPRPSQRRPTPTPSSNRRSRSLDRLTASGTSSDRRNSYLDIRNHTHSLGSQQELAPVFTTTYRTVFSTLTTNTPTTTMNGANTYSNSSRNSLSNGSIGSRFKTAEFTFQKSPVKRRAKW